MSANVNWLYVEANLFLTVGFTGFYSFWQQTDRAETWMALFVALMVNSLVIAPLAVFFLILGGVTASYEYRVRMMELRTQDFTPRSIPEPPPDRPPVPVNIPMRDGTQRICDLPLSEWIAFAKLMRKSGYRFRTRTPGLEYEKWRAILGSNEYMMTKNRDVLNFTDEGKWTLDYIADYSPTGDGPVRYSVIRRLNAISRADAQDGEVVV